MVRALFTSGWNNTEKMVYKIPGVSPEMMKLVIEYAYTRTVSITAENVESLLGTADQFNIMGIIRLCCEFLKSQLCLENCIGICRLTNHYHCPGLRQTAYMFILHNFEELIKVSTEFLDLSIDELTDIIEKDELNVKQEEVVFDAILKWITHDPWQRRQHIPILLSKVRPLGSRSSAQLCHRSVLNAAASWRCSLHVCTAASCSQGMQLKCVVSSHLELMCNHPWV